MEPSLENMCRVLVDHDFELVSNFDQNVFRELAFRDVLRNACTKNSDRSSIEYMNYRNTTLNSFKTFSVKQVMNISPCTENKVNTHVTLSKNDGIHFKVLSKITGYIGGRKMEAAEVKRFMDSLLEYKGDYDEYTVWANAKGIVGMKFGTSLVVEGNDITIPECVANNQL